MVVTSAPTSEDLKSLYHHTGLASQFPNNNSVVQQNFTPHLERMLGLNPQFQGSHPFHMFPGLHAANMNAAAAAAAAAAAVSATSTSSAGGGGLNPASAPPPPISTPSSMSSPGAHSMGGRRDHGGHGGPGAPPPPPPPPHPMNVPLNMWPLIWNHLNNKRTSLLPQLSIAKMDPLSQVFCLKWNNHQNNLLTVLDHLYQTEAFCDVTLACDNTSIKCHKMILSACSSYFQTLFMENTCEHPIVFLKDIKIGEVRAILDYMYKGEVNVAQEELPGLLKVAELLRVKGLVEGDGDKLLNSNKNGRPLVTTSMNEPPTSSTKLNGGHGVGGQEGPGGFRGSEDSRRSSSISENQRDRDNSANRQGDNNGPKLGDSPTSAGAAQAQAAAAAAAAASQRGLPFMLNPQAGGMPFPTFPIPGMFPNLLGARDGLHNRAARMDQDAGSENEREGSPSPGYGQKRKKVASGSGGSSSSKESVGMGHRDDQPLAMDLGRERVDDKGMPHDLEKEMMAQGLDKSGIANYVPSQRLEWKRYKQYTRSDIMAAIEEVKSGISALQASRKYGIPSRTLYDKVKKMGISTGRQGQRKSLPNYPTQFPGLSGMMNIDERDDTNDSSLGAPGEEPRATMVPPTSLSTYMLNIMKGIQPDHGGVSKGPGDSEISLTPMNLSTMLSSHSGSNKLQPRPLPPGTDNSLSPRSPRPHQRDLEDDIVDSTDPRDRMQPTGSGGISGGHRARHSSGGSVHPTHRELNEADIKSQFLADLRRLGGNLPNPNNGDMHHHQLATASSTTNSPPAPAPATPTDENSLPPRKRKVSHEGAAHVTPTKQPIMAAHIAQAPRSPYNGISSHDSDSIAVKKEGVNNSSETENSSAAATSVDCRN